LVTLKSVLLTYSKRRAGVLDCKKIIDKVFNRTSKRAVVSKMCIKKTVGKIVYNGLVD